MKGSKTVPESVKKLIGKSINKVKVLKYNEKKSEPGKPVVDCKCLACGKAFSVNAYHVKYQTAKSCGCVRVAKTAKVRRLSFPVVNTDAGAQFRS